MTNAPKRKLNLNRETIQPLQPGQLDDVNGGNIISASVRASMRFCSQVSRSVWESVKTISYSWSAYEASRSILNSTRK